MSDAVSPDARLIRMANQIATFFLSQPVSEQEDGIANHINKFWEPRMRKRLFELLASDEQGFSPLVRAASNKIKRPTTNADTASET
jgi:formate dehydrogenase subunit delta